MSTEDVIEFARRHGGIFTTSEAVELGMPKSSVNRRVKDGMFVRISRGILCLPGTSTQPDVMLRAAGRILGAVASHRSAAQIHGLTPVGKGRPSVTVTYRRTHSFPDLEVHQSTDLLPEHVQVIGGTTVTTPTRTVVDLAKILPEKQLSRVVDDALASGAVDFGELTTLYQALSRRGKKGMAALGRILRDRAEGQRVSGTVLERRFFKLLADAGVRLPVREFEAPWLERIKGRVDFAYLAERIVIEADSLRWHGLIGAFEVDRRRDIAAQLAGWIVLRITWKMIVDDPDFVVSTVRTALEMREAPSPQS